MEKSTSQTIASVPWRQPGFWAGAAPLLCAVHCLVTPLAVLLIPALSPMQALEPVLLGTVAVIATGAAAAGVRVHGRHEVWLPIGAGLFLWLTAQLGWIPALPEVVGTVVGSVVVAGGLFRNAVLRHRARCSHCGCAVHGAESG